MNNNKTKNYTRIIKGLIFIISVGVFVNLKNQVVSDAIQHLIGINILAIDFVLSGIVNSVEKFIEEIKEDYEEDYEEDYDDKDDYEEEFDLEEIVRRNRELFFEKVEEAYQIESSKILDLVDKGNMNFPKLEPNFEEYIVNTDGIIENKDVTEVMDEVKMICNRFNFNIEHIENQEWYRLFNSLYKIVSKKECKDNFKSLMMKLSRSTLANSKINNEEIKITDFIDNLSCLSEEDKDFELTDEEIEEIKNEIMIIDQKDDTKRLIAHLV